jgi:DNA polymerase III epsilon subunit-like protein
VGGLFALGALTHRASGTVVTADVAYSVIDLETTGLSPDGDRVCEVAVVRVTGDGTVADEYSTLIDPRCDVGPSWIHHITNEAVQGAPTFGDVAGAILERLNASVIVAHNAGFEDRFLAAEFGRLGLRLRPMPALCTLQVARLLPIPIPNHQLATCCGHFSIDEFDAHTALGDTRMTAGLLTACLSLAREEGYDALRFPSAFSALPSLPTRMGPRYRVSRLRKGEKGWMAGIVAKLPITMGDADPVAEAAYLELLADAVSDGKIIGDEAKALGRLAGQAGLSGPHLAVLHERFLEGMHAVAASDGFISEAEYKDLNKVATALSRPDYFADLACDESPPVRRSRKATAPFEVDATELVAFETAVRQPTNALPPPAWHYDPSGRFQFRWWDGARWTQWVAVNGSVVADEGFA